MAAEAASLPAQETALPSTSIRRRPRLCLFGCTQPEAKPFGLSLAEHREPSERGGVLEVTQLHVSCTNRAINGACEPLNRVLAGVQNLQILSRHTASHLQPRDDASHMCLCSANMDLLLLQSGLGSFMSSLPALARPDLVLT